MQKTDTNLQESLPPFQILVKHQADFVPQVGADGWYAWTYHQGWVLETDTGPGVWCRLDLAGKRTKPFAWQPGRWHLYAPGTGYRTGYDDPGQAHPNAWIIFSLAGDLPAPLQRPFSVFADPEERLLSQVEALFRAQEGGGPGRQYSLYGGLLDLLGQLANATAGAGQGSLASPWAIRTARAGTPEPPAALLAKIDAEVVPHLRRPPAVDELAQRLGLSPSSLAHRCQAETGWTVVERIRWLRIREARRRLALAPPPAIKTVAREFGFSSPQYFSRVFREVTGLTPAAFQRRGA
jgi:AraC-like DNA-binding protein